jgi:NitT/TauT family transport system ATP-binding protein
MITHDVDEAVFLAQRIYVLSARPGTVQRELTINLPEDRNYKIKRQTEFYNYTDEIYDLLRTVDTLRS